MFKKSSISTQGDLFSGISQRIGDKKGSYLDNPKGWHNIFFREITSRLDETAYEVLYPSKTGRSNSPIRQLLAMMILKEGENWTDNQLFESSRYNLVVMRALGLQNLTDEPPVASTYYDFKKKLRLHYEQTGVDLLEQTFSTLTHDQVLRYEVSGKRVRMDSKLIASNIAKCTRLQLVISVLQQFYKSISKDSTWLNPTDLATLKDLCSKTADAHTYPLTNEEKQALLERLGLLIQNLVAGCPDKTGSSYEILNRLFSQHYEVPQAKNADADDTPIDPPVQLRDKKTIGGNTLQSPYDTAATFRRKESGEKDQMIKGYSSNITENCTPEELNLILAAQIENAGYSDDQYFEPAILKTEQVLEHLPDEVATDGAYNSQGNLNFIKGLDKNIKWYLTAIQGPTGNFEFEWNDQEQLLVTDKRTGQTQIAKKAKTRASTKNTAPRYRIIEPNGKHRYIEHKAVVTYFRRQQIRQLPREIRNIRPNVEATIHQVFCPLNGQQSKYRGLIAHRHMVFSRCIWVNYRRISDKITLKGRWKAIFDFFHPLLVHKSSYCQSFAVPLFWRQAKLIV